MRSPFRLISFAIMLLAIAHGALVLVGVWQDFAARPSAMSIEPAPESRSVTDRLTQIVPKLSSPASLFCLGAILCVLTRISENQEEESNVG